MTSGLPIAGPAASPSPQAGTADFGDRDRAIVVNTYTTVLRRSAVAHDVFAAYWRDVHGPLCSRLPGLGWYVQHHFDRQQDAHLWPVLDGVTPIPDYVLDGAVEIGFASVADQQVFRDASAILFSDEQNVFDETIAYALPGGSVTVLDRQSDPVPNGPDVLDRVHVHLAPAAGRASELRRYVRDELAPSFSVDVDLTKLRLHLPEHYDNAEPAPPAPNVAHTVSDARADLVMLELAFPTSLHRRAFFAGDAFAATVPALTGLVAHATPFAVAGVHTFVRDGSLTTAGLRGSRVAELITALGAANQVAPSVQDLIATGRAGGSSEA